MEVVINEHVVGRCLLTGSFQRGMRLKQRLRHQPTGIGNPPHADSAAIVRNILDKPIDGVIRVRGFVDRFGIIPVAGRALHYKCAFRLKAAADILRYEDIAIRNEIVKQTGLRQ